jgi:hypothetical protein
VPVALGRGAVQGVRFIADAFGADNAVSKALRGTEDYLADLMSAQAKADSKEISRIMKEAEDKGVGDQVLAAIKALSIAPVDLLSQALGTAAPTIIGGLAGLAARGGASCGYGHRFRYRCGPWVLVSLKALFTMPLRMRLLRRGSGPRLLKQEPKKRKNYTGDNWGSILAWNCAWGPWQV